MSFTPETLHRHTLNCVFFIVGLVLFSHLASPKSGIVYEMLSMIMSDTGSSRLRLNVL